jgi:hypothetical protein
LKRNTPTAIVADMPDTSEREIRETYAISRGTATQLSAPASWISAQRRPR